MSFRAILLPWSINSNERTSKDYILDRIAEIPSGEFHEAVARPIDEPAVGATRCSPSAIYRRRSREISRGTIPQCVAVQGKKSRTTDKSCKCNNCLTPRRCFDSPTDCTGFERSEVRLGGKNGAKESRERGEEEKIDTLGTTAMQTSLVILARKSHRADPLLTKQFSSNRRTRWRGGAHDDATSTHNKIRREANHVRPSSLDTVHISAQRVRRGHRREKRFPIGVSSRFLLRDICIYRPVRHGPPPARGALVFHRLILSSLCSFSFSLFLPRRFVPLTAISTLSFRCHRCLFLSLSFLSFCPPRRKMKYPPSDV